MSTLQNEVLLENIYEELMAELIDTGNLAMMSEDDINDLCKFARQMSTICEFPEYKQVPRIKQHLNACIRNEIELDDLTLEALAHDNNCDVNVLRLWKLVESIKMDMFTYIDAENTVECYIGEDRCDHEGYVLHNKYGTFKIVNREGFSRANFNLVREWD